jgi:hypothetical protein
LVVFILLAVGGARDRRLLLELLPETRVFLDESRLSACASPDSKTRKEGLRMTEAVQTLAEAATALAEADRKRPKEAKARLRKWVKRAIAELPADSLNRLAAMCAMHLDQETLKRTGKSPGYAKSVVEELAAEQMAKLHVARMNGSAFRWRWR